MIVSCNTPETRMPDPSLPVRPRVAVGSPAPVALCPALAEIAEYATRAPHLDFRAARANALVDALRTACNLSESAGPPARC